MKPVCIVLQKSSWKRLFTSISVFLLFVMANLMLYYQSCMGEMCLYGWALVLENPSMFLAPVAVSGSAVGVVTPLNGLMEQEVSNFMLCVSHLLAKTHC